MGGVVGTGHARLVVRLVWLVVWLVLLEWYVDILKVVMIVGCFMSERLLNEAASVEVMVRRCGARQTRNSTNEQDAGLSGLVGVAS